MLHPLLVTCVIIGWAACGAAASVRATEAEMTATSSPPTAAAGPSAVLLDSSSLTHFSFGSCNKQELPQPMWRHVMERRPQLWIWLGDVIYADRGGRSPVSEMKRMYRQQYEQADYARLRQSDTKIVGIYDDHDYGENDGDATYVDKEPARQLFLDFVDEPATSPRRDRLGVYESYKWGKPAPSADASAANATSAAPSVAGGVTQLILLDSRYHQDPGADDMLGAAQWLWLEVLLADPSPVDLFIVGSGVQLVSRDKRIGEGWRLLPKSRARLLDLFARRPHNKNAALLFLSGDVHFAESNVTYACADAGAGSDTASTAAAANTGAGPDAAVDSVTVTPFYELTSSGLTHSISSQFGGFAADWGLPWLLDERRSWAEDSGLHTNASIRGFYTSKNFGDVTVDWSAQTVHVEFVGVDGAAKLSHTLPFAALRSSTLLRAQLPPLVCDVCADEVVWANLPRLHPSRLRVRNVKMALLLVAATALLGLALAAWLLRHAWRTRRGIGVWTHAARYSHTADAAAAVTMTGRIESKKQR